LVTGHEHRRRFALLAGMVVLLAACGGTATTRSDATTLPGQGKPTIVLGDTSSDEELLLGELYAQAFRAMGYIVDLKPNIGGSQQADTAFQSGQINAYPEYLGEVAATDAGHTAPLTSESQAEQFAQQYEQAHGATVMMPVTPFSNTGELVTLESFAQQRNLTTIEQVKSVPFRLKFGDYAAEQTRYDGYVGLEQAYGLTNLQFVPLPMGSSIYDALDTHLVQVGDAFLTDPQLAGGTYAVLSDPKNIFGFQHVALIIKTSLLNQLGPAFQRTYTSVTNLLTITVMRALNRAVTIDRGIPASVAHSFLLANHLLSS
jgi:osmoprotectant transport system substrate-binding protein